MPAILRLAVDDVLRGEFVEICVFAIRRRVGEDLSVVIVRLRIARINRDVAVDVELSGASRDRRLAPDPKGGEEEVAIFHPAEPDAARIVPDRRIVLLVRNPLELHMEGVEFVVHEPLRPVVGVTRSFLASPVIVFEVVPAIRHEEIDP